MVIRHPQNGGSNKKQTGLLWDCRANGRLARIEKNISL